MTYQMHISSFCWGILAAFVAFGSWTLGIGWNDKPITPVRPVYLSFDAIKCQKGQEKAFAVYEDGQQQPFCPTARPKVKL